MNTREMIREFSLAFGRPVNDSVVRLTVAERELLGKLILEECLEYVTKGLGLRVTFGGMLGLDHTMLDTVSCELNEGQMYDPVESADGLGDMNVVVHFNSLWHGFDIDAVTAEIHRSNMSKLDEAGNPIVNQCVMCAGTLDDGFDGHVCELIGPTKPAGKILKGPNYSPPDIAKVLGLGILVGYDFKNGFDTPESKEK